MSLILTTGLSDQKMYDSLALISEQDVVNRMFTIEQVAYAKHLWKCGWHEAEQRLANGNLPDDPSQKEE